MTGLENIFLYRMTHIDNVPHILSHGIVHESSVNANANFVAIGDSSLISHRKDRIVTTVGGRMIKLGDFIPFYFGVRMPMLYIIQHGFNFVKARRPEEIIYVVLPLTALSATDNELYFSAGHATDSITRFYETAYLPRLPQLLDWDAIKSRLWSGVDVPTDTKRRKQAELLIRGDISPALIHGFLCYDERTKQHLVGMGISESKVKVFPKAYY